MKVFQNYEKINLDYINLDDLKKIINLIMSPVAVILDNEIIMYNSYYKENLSNKEIEFEINILKNKNLKILIYKTNKLELVKTTIKLQEYLTSECDEDEENEWRRTQ